LVTFLAFGGFHGDSSGAAVVAKRFAGSPREPQRCFGGKSVAPSIASGYDPCEKNDPNAQSSFHLGTTD
jgi:hypothetical protein